MRVIQQSGLAASRLPVRKNSVRAPASGRSGWGALGVGRSTTGGVPGSSVPRFWKAGERRRRLAPSATEEETTRGLSQGLGRRWSLSLHQQSHPTHVVAGVEILRHTSVHKGSPLFHRRAPALITVDPRGLPTTRITLEAASLRGTPRGGRNDADHGNRADAIRGARAFSSRGPWGMAGRAHRCRR